MSQIWSEKTPEILSCKNKLKKAYFYYKRSCMRVDKFRPDKPDKLKCYSSGRLVLPTQSFFRLKPVKALDKDSDMLQNTINLI